MVVGETRGAGNGVFGVSSAPFDQGRAGRGAACGQPMADLELVDGGVRGGSWWWGGVNDVGDCTGVVIAHCVDSDGAG